MSQTSGPLVSDAASTAPPFLPARTIVRVGHSNSHVQMMKCRLGNSGIRSAIPSNGLSQLAHVNIDVEIDIADASLRTAMRTSLVPGSVTRAGISDIGQPQAPPLR